MPHSMEDVNEFRVNRENEPQKPDAVLPWQLLKDILSRYGEYLGSEKGLSDRMEMETLAKKYPNNRDDEDNKTFIPEDVSIFAEVIRCAWYPVRDRLNSEYFLLPYTKVSCGVKGFFAGPFMAAAVTMSPSLEVPILSEVARIALVVPALLEFSQGLIYMIKALYYKIAGDDVRARMYFRDGATRLFLTPCLLIAAVVSVAIEFIRFLSRLAMTIVHAFRGMNAPTQTDRQEVVVRGVVYQQGNKGDVPDLNNTTTAHHTSDWSIGTDAPEERGLGLGY